ncbi:hypothetical protein I4U23_014960 [Adineta vaga]|nr:hypothetical protein I4U23_014960 [Adineta vaga]
MVTSINMMQTGYTDAYGRPIDNDVQKWFKNGVRPIGEERKSGICSSQTTCYIFLGIICFILVCVIIIVPLVIASLHPRSSS